MWEVMTVVIAAAVSYGFGAIWYMSLARPWMAAAGVSDAEVQKGGGHAYVVSALSALIVAGMMRHVFALSGIETLPEGAVAGFGIGLFLATPWIATNYAFAQRPLSLMLIDGGYATIGCTLMGAALTLL